MIAKPTLHQLTADVLGGIYPHDGWIGPVVAGLAADRLLADPTLAAIIRLAETHCGECLGPDEWFALGPEVLACLGWVEGTPR